MARLKQQAKDAGSMRKIKQRLDSMHLKYTEKINDKSTMIKVRSMQIADQRHNALDKAKDCKA